jgi:acetaldehyde dehydrogenase/alcohol dehydrogenase
MANQLELDPIMGEYLRGFSLQQFEGGKVLLSQGQQSEGCFIIEQGHVRALVSEDELERSASLDLRYGPGDMLGVKELFTSEVLPFSFIAEGDVAAIYVSKDELNNLLQEHPEIYPHLIQAIAKQYQVLEQGQIDQALSSAPISEVDFMLEKAKQAHGAIQSYSEEKIDDIIAKVAEEVAKHADNLSKLTVAESHMGVAEHKVEKIKLGTLAVADDLIGKPGVGSIIEDGDSVKGIANSMGVVFAMIPVTNPVETLTFKFLISLKSRNAVIMSSHRRARNVGAQTVEIIQSVLKKLKVPVDLIQTPQLPASRALTNAFMTHQDVNFILATGGPSMVKSAYQSGTPAIGVGKGNAPVWITADCNLEKAANDVIFSKSFDNGIVCGSENNLLVAASVYDDFLLAAEANGAAVLNPIEVDSLLDALFANGALNSDWVGRSAQDVCDHVGIVRNYPVRLIMAPVPEGSDSSPLLKEKLIPILSVSKMDSKAEALALAKSILDSEGSGHTAIIHCDDNQMVQEYAKVVDVSRILVNTPGTLGCIGANNGLELSWTLGCGTQGGGATSDNVGYKHLLNIKRIAYAHDDA